MPPPPTPLSPTDAIRAPIDSQDAEGMQPEPEPDAE